VVTTPAAWLRLVGGVALIFALFQWSATTLQSDRGQAGLIVAALVVAGGGGPARRRVVMDSNGRSFALQRF